MEKLLYAGLNPLGLSCRQAPTFLAFPIGRAPTLWASVLVNKKGSNTIQGAIALQPNK
jgi:hypothetical protein